MQTNEPQSLLEKPLTIDTERFRPLPKTHQGQPCSACAKPQSLWAFIPTDGPGADQIPMLICSRCFLYESGWGTIRQKELTQYLADLTKETGQAFEFSADGRLLHDRDCNMTVAAIAAFSCRLEEWMREASKLQEKQSNLVIPATGQFVVRN